MKFSRNPKTGILEAYTDDGQYMGSIYTMGDCISENEKSEDKDIEKESTERQNTLTGK